MFVVAALLRVVRGLIAATIIFLITGELLARTTGLLDRLNGYTHLIVAPGPELDLPYLLRPNLTTSLGGVTIRTNRYGLRGGEITAIPPPSTRRLLLLGDSVVFGQEIPEEQTVAGLLPRQLAARGLGTTEVLNAGVPGYDTVSEARLLALVGLALRPDTVVVGMSLNDHDVTPQYSPYGLLVRKELDQRAPSLVDRSEFVALLGWVVRWARGDLLMQLVAAQEVRQGGPQQPRQRIPPVEENIRTLRLAFYRNPVPAYWQRLRDALATIQTLCETRGIRALVAIFPEAFQVETTDPDRTPQVQLLAACREAHIECLDLQPAFFRVGGDLFNDVSHPNAAGHALAAEAIARTLARPPGAQPPP